MKNVKKAFLSTLLCSFLLASCSNHERKINPETGVNTIILSLNNTKEKVKTLSEGEIFAVDSNGSLNGHVSLEVINNQDVLSSNNIEISSSFSLISNQYLNKMKDESNFDISSNELYLKTQLNLKDGDRLTDENKITYIKGYDVISQQVNPLGENIKNIHTLNQQEANKYALEVLDAIKDYTSDNFFEDVLEIENPETIKECKQKLSGFIKGEISAEEFVEFLDAKVFEGEMFEENEVESKACLTRLLQRYKDISTIPHLDFTKRVSDGITTLFSSFDYQSWHDSFIKIVDDIIVDLKKEHASYTWFDTLKNDLILNLPDALQLSFTVELNQQEYITGFSFDITTNGSINNMFKQGSMNPMLIYDIDLSCSYKAEFFDKLIEVPSLVFTK